MKSRNAAGVFGSGLAIGILGGLIGLGGAEFRLPLLIGVFGFSALPAVIMNKATSLVVVAASFSSADGCSASPPRQYYCRFSQPSSSGPR